MTGVHIKFFTFVFVTTVFLSFNLHISFSKDFFFV